MFRCVSCGALNQVTAARGGQPVCGRCKKDLDTSGKPQEVDGAALEVAVRSASVPVLLDCWAPWCGPCRAIAPRLEAYAKAHAGKLLVLKLNTDQHPVPSQAMGIQSIPTFIVFRGGQELGRRSGMIPEDLVEEALDSGASGARA